MKIEKNRIILILFAAAVLLTGLVLLGIRFGPALAKAFSGNDLAGTNEMLLVNDAELQTEEAYADDPVALLETMVKVCEERTFSQTGWLHYTYSHDSDVENGVILPDGRMMPKDYVVDAWYHINENGNVFEHVITYGDGAGEVYQGERYANNTIIGWPFDGQLDDIQPYQLSLDLGVAKDIIEAYGAGSAISSAEGLFHGKAVTKFSSVSDYDPVMQLSNSSQPVKQLWKSLYFDKETGDICEAEVLFILEDGTEEVFYQLDISWAWDDLPPEQAALLVGEN